MVEKNCYFKTFFLMNCTPVIEGFSMWPHPIQTVCGPQRDGTQLQGGCKKKSKGLFSVVE